MALEQEVKLLVSSDNKIDLSLMPFLLAMADGKGVTDHLVSTYFDTDALELSKQGLGLRMRQINEQFLQTVKTSGKVKDGLHQREEWEDKLDGPEWDIAILRHTPLKAIIDKPECWSQLSALFTTDFLRETLQLTLDDGSQIELAYDRGEVRAGELKAPIHEIELELKTGDSDQLILLANRLCQQLPVSPSDISKAQMGYELVAKNRENEAIN